MHGARLRYQHFECLVAGLREDVEPRAADQSDPEPNPDPRHFITSMDHWTGYRNFPRATLRTFLT